MSKRIKLKDGEVFSVTSKPDRFRRSGILFSKEPTLLDKDTMTETILNEPMLIVEKVELPEEEDEGIKRDGPDSPEGDRSEKADPEKQEGDPKR